MELINREDIVYVNAYGYGQYLPMALKQEIEKLPTYDGVTKEQIIEASRTLNQRALEAYKKAVKSRQAYDLLGDPMEKDRALRYEGYADGFTRAAHYLEITFGVKLEEE